MEGMHEGRCLRLERRRVDVMQRGVRAAHGWTLCVVNATNDIYVETRRSTVRPPVFPCRSRIRDSGS